MVDDYLATTQPISEEVLSTNFSGNFTNTIFANLMAEAIYYSAKSLGKTIDFAICNSARSGFNGTTLTYRDLYKSFPFDNQIILMDVSSDGAIQTMDYNETYRENTCLVPTAGNTYHVAVIDYLGLHQNQYREYNYFPEVENFEVLCNSNNEPLIYREVLKDYLKKNPDKEFSASDYTSSNPHFTIN